MRSVFHKPAGKPENNAPGPMEKLRLRSGAYAAGLTVAAVVLAVLVNLVVRAVPTRYTQFDLTEAGLYTLSDGSRQMARSLPQDVTIYYLVETGSEDTIITKLLDRYAAESSRIRWELKDPAVYPTFGARYGAGAAQGGSLIFVSGGRSRVLEAADLYDHDYSGYSVTGSETMTFGGESRITAALYQVTGGQSLAVYYTTNHGEQALTDTLTQALEAQSLTAAPLDLLTETIPQDCSLLVINTPQQDFGAAGALVDEMQEMDTSGNIASETVGGHSISYADVGAMAKSKRLMSVAKTYLSFTGLMYCGVVLKC